MRKAEVDGYEDGRAGRLPRSPTGMLAHRVCLAGWYRGFDDRRRLPDDARERVERRAKWRAALVARQASTQLDLDDMVARAP